MTHLLVFSTDADFHFAGDGGIVLPNESITCIKIHMFNIKLDLIFEPPFCNISYL